MVIPGNGTNINVAITFATSGTNTPGERNPEEHVDEETNRRNWELFTRNNGR